MVTFAINTHFIRKRSVQAVLTVFGPSGVVLIFLPFIYDDVPVWYFLEWLPGALGSEPEFWALAPCVILPFMIFAGYLRWLLTGTSWTLESPKVEELGTAIISPRKETIHNGTGPRSDRLPTSPMR